MLERFGKSEKVRIDIYMKLNYRGVKGNTYEVTVNVAIVWNRR
jgi:hypothetical protein